MIFGGYLLVITASLSLGRSEYLDMSYDVSEESIYWPTGSGFTRSNVVRDYQPAGFWYHNEDLSFPEHISTHLDAPSHFDINGWTVDQIPLTHLMGPAVKIDISEKVASNPKAVLTTGDLYNWWDAHGDFPNGTIVFVYTGWGSRYGNKTAYFGSSTPTDTSTFKFPAISVEAAKILAQYEGDYGRRIVGVGIDTPSMDESDSKIFKVHTDLSAANIYGLENVANMEQLPSTGASVIIMPIKVKDGSGGPARIIAELPQANAAAAAALAAPTSDSSYTRSPLLLLVLLGSVHMLCNYV